VPVLDSEMRVVGIVASPDLVVGWRIAMRHAIRRLGRAARHAMLVEATVEDGAPADGTRVDELALPRGAVLVALLRGNGLMFADGDTVLAAGDVVSAFTRRGDEQAVQQLLHAPAPSAATPPARTEPTG
jgi:Trk K+ transport system NAD-binding subunit